MCDSRRPLNGADSGVAQEAECSTCGAQIMVPWDEDPEDTLCVACAEEEQGQ